VTNECFLWLGRPQAKEIESASTFQVAQSLGFSGEFRKFGAIAADSPVRRKMREESKSSNALSQPSRSRRAWGELRQWQDLLRVVKSLNEGTLCNTNQPFQDALAD